MLPEKYFIPEYSICDVCEDPHCLNLHALFMYKFI